jgi:hypothetical protein
LDDQQLKIMILAVEMSCRKSAIAAPERIDQFPILCGSKPKVDVPPQMAQV